MNIKKQTNMKTQTKVKDNKTDNKSIFEDTVVPEISERTYISKLAKDIESIQCDDIEHEYTMYKDVLVIPIYTAVVKEITTQIPTGKKDENGYETYDTKTENKEVESDFSRGRVIGIPRYCDNEGIKLGDIIVYNKKFAKDFDLHAKSQLVKPYDIVALVK